jgi:myo-inositol-1(or 4)-monophosphatase
MAAGSEGELPLMRRAAEAAALAGGAVLMEGFGSQIVSRTKGGNLFDLVTEFDVAADKVIEQHLRAAFPGIPVMSEERVTTAPTQGTYWCVDPLDGTGNFAHGYPYFAVSIALCIGEDVLLGVVYDPIRDELFAADRGNGATINGAEIRVSDVDDLSRALIVVAFPPDFRTDPSEELAVLARAQVEAQTVRMTGASALDLAWVAAGRADAFWASRLHLWDFAAGALLVTEADGEVSANSDSVPDGRSAVFASNAPLQPDFSTMILSSSPNGDRGSMG